MTKSFIRSDCFRNALHTTYKISITINWKERDFKENYHKIYSKYTISLIICDFFSWKCVSRKGKSARKINGIKIPAYSILNKINLNAQEGVFLHNEIVCKNKVTVTNKMPHLEYSFINLLLTAPPKVFQMSVSFPS